MLLPFPSGIAPRPTSVLRGPRPNLDSTASRRTMTNPAATENANPAFPPGQRRAVKPAGNGSPPLCRPRRHHVRPNAWRGWAPGRRARLCARPRGQGVVRAKPRAARSFDAQPQRFEILAFWADWRQGMVGRRASLGENLNPPLHIVGRRPHQPRQFPHVEQSGATAREQ